MAHEPDVKIIFLRAPIRAESVPPRSIGLIGTAKLHGLDPERYRRYVLSRLPDHPINRIEEFLPRNVVQPGADHCAEWK
jgi:hypothetical protein